MWFKPFDFCEKRWQQNYIIHYKRWVFFNSVIIPTLGRSVSPWKSSLIGLNLSRNKRTKQQRHIVYVIYDMYIWNISSICIGSFNLFHRLYRFVYVGCVTSTLSVSFKLFATYMRVYKAAILSRMSTLVLYCHVYCFVLHWTSRLCWLIHIHDESPRCSS